MAEVNLILDQQRSFSATAANVRPLSELDSWLSTLVRHKKSLAPAAAVQLVEWLRETITRPVLCPKSSRSHYQSLLYVQSLDRYTELKDRRISSCSGLELAVVADDQETSGSDAEGIGSIV